MYKKIKRNKNTNEMTNIHHYFSLKMYSTGAFILFFCLKISAQNTINLFPNPSLEEINTCKKYHEPCSPRAWRSTILKNFRYPEYNPTAKHFFKPANGERCAAFSLYNGRIKNERYFMQTPLLCPLKKGEQYKLSFSFRPEDVTVQSFGVYFADTLQVHEKNDDLLKLQAHVEFVTDEIVAPQTWQKVEAIYTAKGGELGFIIGNFNPDDDTKTSALVKTKKRKNRKKRTQRIYYAFDDFQLIPINSKSVDCDIRVNQAYIYRDSLRHIPDSPIRLSNQVSVEDNEQFYAKPKPKIKPKAQNVVINEVPIKVKETFELPNINFESNSENLLPEAYPALEKVAAFLQKNKNYRLKIIGHTDNVGSPMMNRQLSEDRARSVARFLIQNGVLPDQLRTQGKGETEPVTENWSEEGKRRNRRVEFVLL